MSTIQYEREGKVALAGTVTPLWDPHQQRHIATEHPEWPPSLHPWAIAPSRPMSGVNAACRNYQASGAYVGLMIEPLYAMTRVVAVYRQGRLAQLVAVERKAEAPWASPLRTLPGGVPQTLKRRDSRLGAPGIRSLCRAEVSVLGYLHIDPDSGRSTFWVDDIYVGSTVRKGHGMSVIDHAEMMSTLRACGFNSMMAMAVGHDLAIDCERMRQFVWAEHQRALRRPYVDLAPIGMRLRLRDRGAWDAATKLSRGEYNGWTMAVYVDSLKEGMK